MRRLMQDHSAFHACLEILKLHLGMVSLAPRLEAGAKGLSGFNLIK